MNGVHHSEGLAGTVPLSPLPTCTLLTARQRIKFPLPAGDTHGVAAASGQYITWP